MSRKITIRDDEGHIQTMITVTPFDGNEELAESVAAMIREEYQTTPDVIDVEKHRDRDLQDGESRDGSNGTRPVPPGVDSPTEVDDE